MESAGAVAVGGGAEVQRTNSSNLRDLLRIDVERTSSAILLDFLRIKQEDSCRNNISASSCDGGGGGGSGGGGDGNTSNRQTLGSVLSLTKNSISSDRSLLDVIRDEPSGSVNGASIRDTKKNWRDIRKRLKLRRAAPIPAPDVPISPISHRLSLSELLQRTASQALDRGSALYNSVGNVEEAAVNEGVGESSGGVEEPVRMSLMALLAETDSANIINGNKLDEGQDEEGEEEVGKLLEYNACCVCMVRHKGAAFIPCGHTFCRLCSRELYVQRGNCPVCNSLILEILDIF